MKLINLKKEFLLMSLRLIIIIISLIGIFAPTQNSFLGQFWFFTLQTNLFVIILMSILIISQIFKIFNTYPSFTSTSWFGMIRVSITFYITITGVIFCFILAPVAVITNSYIATSLNYRDIFLHIFVPMLTIIEYYSSEYKPMLKKSNALLFLIYPIIYVLSIFIRAALGGTAFPGGSIYPYFFIDPSFNNQGWLSVLFFISLCIIAFYLLALLYVFFNNKLSSNQK